MSKSFKRILSLIMAIIAVFSMFSVVSFAANYSTSYGSYTQPNTSSDYAYWNGSKVVKASGTTTSEIKWMQSSMNYLISVGYLSGSKLDVDGSFGPASKAMCLKFQAKTGLSQDGKFGPNTITKMINTLKDKPWEKKTSTTSKYNLLWPVPSNSGYSVSSRMGTRTAPLPGGSTDHKGIDIAVKSGTNIYSTAYGKVIDKGYSANQRGYYVVILHENQNLISIYQHMKSAATVNIGDTVSQGKVIGYVGTTGNSTGNHLHFGLVVANSTSRRTVSADQNGTLINPIKSNSNISYTYK